MLASYGHVAPGAEQVRFDSGNLWVTNNGLGFGSSVSEFSSNGDWLGTFTVGAAPEDIAFDATGDVWVTNGSSASVTKLAPDGTVLATYPTGNLP